MNNGLELLDLLNQWNDLESFCLKTLGCRILILGPNCEGLLRKEETGAPCRYIIEKRDGYLRCLSSYKNGCFSRKTDEPYIFTCHLGLANFVFPIILKNKPLSFVIVGGILVEERKKEILSKIKKMIDQKKISPSLLSLKAIKEDELSSLFSLAKLAISPLLYEIKEKYELFLKVSEAIKREDLIRIDEVTGLHNRQYFIHRLSEEMSKAKRRKHPLSIIVFRFDQFKPLVDIHGSIIREPILKETAQILLKFTRREDVLVRTDEDEFFLLLPHTPQEEAMVLGKRISERIEEHPFCKEQGLEISLTISCGISQLEKEETPEEFFEKASKALFSAKARGGRKITFFSKIRDKEPKRCVITGIGVVTPIGMDENTFWNNLCNGKSGISRISQFDVSNMPVKIAGEIKGFDPSLYMDRKSVNRSDRATQIAIAATKLAISSSKIELDREDKERIPVIIGAGVGGLAFAEEQVAKFLTEGPEKISPFLSIITFSGALSSMVSLAIGVNGPSITVSTGCPAGTDAIGYGFEAIRKGEAEIVIAGGAEAPIRPVVIHSFYAMHALSLRNDEPEKASRPFDLKRDGFIIAEGGGMVILEELNHALNRNAHIYAEVVGYASTNDAYHMTAPAPDGKAASKCFRMALEEAGIKPEDVGYINPHGSSTPLNDKTETKVIKDVFGEFAYKIPVSSTKSMLGHSIGATGAIEAIVCALAIENGFIPPTINYEELDPECDLDYVPNIGRRANINIAFTNSFGFGGKNSALVIKRYQR